MLVAASKYLLIKGTAVPTKINSNNISDNNNNNNNNNNNTLIDELYQIPLEKPEGKKQVNGQAPETDGAGTVADKRI
jgi:hypothetical protein